MKITAIKQQIKRADRYSIYIDGKYLFSFSEPELLNLSLKVGQEFTAKELDKLKNSAASDKGYDRALNLISHRPRSEWELQDYLCRKDYDQAVISGILNRLKKAGYIDDLDFAQRWMVNRRLLRSISKRRLQQELRQKRVNAEIIEQVLNADEGDEAEILKELIAKKRTQSRYQDQQKLIQFLSRQGFSYSTIKQALADQD